ncbi:hypothetical protein GQ457_03G010110 [Hibiscus cannabinus]
MEKGDREKENSKDRISELPDATLFIILSFLTIKEVANICFLSKRLKDLLPHIVSFNFDASPTLTQLRKNGNLRKNKRSWYINWVNHVLELHQGTTINEFRVRFDFDWTCGHDIDSWFHFAISKRVRKLEFDFEEVADETWPPGLRSYSLTKSCFDYIRAPPGLSCIGSLNSLCLRFVKVSGQVLEHFLMHCPLLEKLVVEWSKSLVSLKVASSSPLRLQYLEIRSCLSLQNLEISAPNLRTFLYYGQKMALYIEDAPVLANVLIGGNLDDEPAFAFCPLSSYLCQLETLTLEMSAYNMMFLEFPKLTKLRHLVVIVYGGYDDDLLVLASLIDAAPSLNKLTLELKIWRSATYNHHAHSSSSATGKPIHSLKEIEVTGFRGFKIDVDFVTYLLEHGRVIEKITINCCHQSWIGKIWEWESIKEREKARKHALQLKSKSSPTTEFVVV